MHLKKITVLSIKLLDAYTDESRKFEAPGSFELSVANALARHSWYSSLCNRYKGLHLRVCIVIETYFLLFHNQNIRCEC